ncbi:MAG: hypothetical protein ABIL58_23350 [Pseudomonadota bacterium]
MTKAKPTQAEFKAFERLFNKIRKANVEKRRDATGTLTPAIMRKYLANGAPLDLLYGVRPDGTPFTSDDLKAFDKRAQAVRKKYKASKKGVRIDQLIASSQRDDIKRANAQIRSAILYRIFNGKDGVLLHFRVSASEGSRDKFHQVKIRLEEWTDWLTSTLPLKKASEKILGGRVSFDCDCGRHQFWYRYLATVGGFAVHPLEHAYPKIRNPRLAGACCKHVLKSMATIRGAAVKRMIVAEMEKAAKQIGYGDDVKVANRFLTQPELEKAARSSAAKKGLSIKAAREAFKEYLASRKGIRKKMEEPKTVSALEKMTIEKKTMEAIARKEQARAEEEQKKAERLSRDLLRSNLQNALILAKYRDKIEPEKAMADFAKANGIPLKDVKLMSEEISV